MGTIKKHLENKYSTDVFDIFFFTTKCIRRIFKKFGGFALMSVRWHIFWQLDRFSKKGNN